MCYRARRCYGQVDQLSSCPPIIISASAAPHRIPAIQTFVARGVSHGDAAADVAGGGVGLEVARLLADRVGDDGETEIGRRRWIGGRTLTLTLSRITGRGVKAKALSPALSRS